MHSGNGSRGRRWADRPKAQRRTPVQQGEGTGRHLEILAHDAALQEEPGRVLLLRVVSSSAVRVRGCGALVVLALYSTLS